jgi:hypothetical protein
LTQEDKNDPQKQNFLKENSCSSARCSLLMAEGFFYSLHVLYRGLGIVRTVAIFDPKSIYIEKFCCNFFQIFGHRILDPDPFRDSDCYSAKMLDAGEEPSSMEVQGEGGTQLPHPPP